MKLITAILQPAVLTEVQVALAQHGITGMTVSECAGYGRQNGHREVYRGAEYTIDFVAKARLELLVTDEASEAVIRVITDTAHTGNVGDGKIWSTPADDIVRIRTGERGDAAL
ncbi:P-II family nitrogen regulator [Gulosibacter molinativorax]|uniref:Nitrogen regulatory protein P-II n=1 Tax=Gulosibacter molinativorax TaxID=256821 RepID=A0ABT7C5H4_9MICO|nr:P-II family nitrogen regulator [Gulosibacter molinativorax]MDJ1370348.1 P-II family nitrogen regulator [Gulosibacter molinativorax]QUY61261.1 Nitrogen regulatory protein P-II [Gulosibacter molinativorax]